MVGLDVMVRWGSDAPGAMLSVPEAWDVTAERLPVGSELAAGGMCPGAVDNS